MDITLPPDLEAYVEQRVRRGGFASPSEFIQQAVRRKMEDDAWYEERIVEAERTELSPLTEGDLKSIRDLIKRRASRTA